MNYPSSTQALFALIVMIIVLLFILVYCCWGTFSCSRQEDASAPTTEEGAGSNGQHGVRHILRGPHTVIVPINNMIYVGDPETHQIYQIPLDRDKPPAYTEVFRAGPPPPYRPDIAASDSELSGSTTTHREQHDNRTTMPESPPTYDECLTAAPEEFGAEQMSSDAASDTPQQQQQQEVAATSETPTGTPAPAVTETPPPPVPDPAQEAQESPSPRTDLVLTVSTLPQEIQQASSQPAEGPNNAPPAAQNLRGGKGQ